MKKLLIILALSSPVLAQTTTIYTGVIKDLAGNPVTSGKVTFTLAPATDSTIPGSGRFVPTTIACTINVDGTLSAQPSGACTVASNTSLSPTGTSYKVCIQPYFAQPGSCFFDYATVATKDISTAAPTLSTGPLNYSGIPGPPLNFLGTWVSTTIYPKGALVVSGNNTYISLQPSNLNNSPASSPTFWSLTQTSPSIIPNPSGSQTVVQPDVNHPLAVNYLTITGAAVGVSINSTLNAALFTGADAGSQINAAYAALPAAGGKIIYPVPVGGLSFSTPINFGTANKPAVLSCFSASGSGNDTLIYTASGTGITFNNGPGAVASGPSGSGIRDCDFQATNSSATMLFLGGSNGAEGSYISNSKFFGGALTVGLGDNTWDVKFDHVKIYGGTQLLVTSGTTNAGENIQFDHVAFLSSGTFANAVVLGASGSGAGLNSQCNSCSFDNAQLVVTGGEVEVNSTHFEDPGSVVWPAAPLVINGGNVALNTATFFGDHPSGTLIPSYISITSGILTSDALTTFGCNCTSIYNSSGTGKILGGAPLSLAGPTGTVITLITDTSSELSTVDGGRNYAIHGEGPHNIRGWVTFDSSSPSGIHIRTSNTQANVGNYVEQLGYRLVGTPDLTGYYTGKMQVARCGSSGYSSSLNFFTENKSSANQADTSRVVGVLDCTGGFSASGIISIGSAATITGCSATSFLGGSSAGQFHAGSTSCSVTITMGGVIAPTGWYCGKINDITTPSDSASWNQTGFSTTSASLSGTAVSGDVIQFGCIGY